MKFIWIWVWHSERNGSVKPNLTRKYISNTNAFVQIILKSTFKEMKGFVFTITYNIDSIYRNK